MPTDTSYKVTIAPELLAALNKIKNKQSVEDTMSVDDTIIDLSTLSESAKIVPILPPCSEIIEREVKREKTAEPFKNLSDVRRILAYLIDHKQYRNYLFFALGMTFGLRVKDLLELKFYDVINENYTFKDFYRIPEHKTGKIRKIYIKNAIKHAILTYLQYCPNTKLDDYMFKSRESYSVNKQRTDTNDFNMELDGKQKAVSDHQMNRVIHKVCNELNIIGQYSTHSLRKSFGYHIMKQSNNDPRKLLILQRMYNHSSTAVTLIYIGITDDEIEQTYEDLNVELENEIFDTDIGEERIA